MNVCLVLVKQDPQADTQSKMCCTLKMCRRSYYGDLYASRLFKPITAKCPWANKTWHNLALTIKQLTKLITICFTHRWSPWTGLAVCYKRSAVCFTCCIFRMMLMFGPNKIFLLFTLVKCFPLATSSVAFLHGRPRFRLNTTDLGVSPTGKVTFTALCFLLAVSAFTLDPAVKEVGVFSALEARIFLFEDNCTFSLEDDWTLPFLRMTSDSWAL